MDDPAHKAVVSGMIILFAIIVITAGACIYKWHLKARQNQEVLNKWKMAYPSTTVYK